MLEVVSVDEKCLTLRKDLTSSFEAGIVAWSAGFFVLDVVCREGLKPAGRGTTVDESFFFSRMCSIWYCYSDNLVETVILTDVPGVDFDRQCTS